MSQTEQSMTADERMYLFETVMIAFLEEATHEPARFHRLSKLLQAKLESIEAKAGDCPVTRKLKELQDNARKLYLAQSSQRMKQGLAASGLAPDLAKKPN